jgi:hypothetical protein
VREGEEEVDARRGSRGGNGVAGVRPTLLVAAGVRERVE